MNGFKQKLALAPDPILLPNGEHNSPVLIQWSSPVGRIFRNAVWLRTPSGRLTVLIFATLLLRLIFAISIGLGIDESYMVAAGRSLHLSYFDHPPLAWWIATAAARLFGTEAAGAVRLPFVIIFALTTWLMFRLTARLFNPRAGLWAAACLNIAPVFGITTGSWVLPDGPLIAALLGAAICLVEALDRAAEDAWGWWLAAGCCAGFALLSKYSAILAVAGAMLFLLTTASRRHWLTRPHPYVASLVALAIFSPVIIWNAKHGWVSLLFQGGRAGLARVHLAGPLTTTVGEALFLLPWIWLALVWCTYRELCERPRNERARLLVCLALPPILLFTILSFWSHVLFHWAAPGYLMLFPLLGAMLERFDRGGHPVRLWLGVSAILVLGATLLVASEIRFNWLPEFLTDFAPDKDPDLEAVDWTSIRSELTNRGLLSGRQRVIAAIRWLDAGKLDYALGGAVKVICLGPDPREYGVINNLSDLRGRDILIVAPRTNLAQVMKQVGSNFDKVEPLPTVELRHADRPAMAVPLYFGHNLHIPEDR